MQHAISPALLQTLRRGIGDGHWTLEQLDTPSPGFKVCTKVQRSWFKNGYQGVQHRNLLRDTPAAEKVQFTNDKDLPPLPHGITPAQADQQPLNLYAEETLASGLQESSSGQSQTDDAHQLPVDGKADGSVFELW